MGVRSTRRKLRQIDMAQSRIVNGLKKRKERARRALRMKELIDKGEYPYTPPIMHWLSTQLNKPTNAISEEDIRHFLQSA